MGCKFLRKVVDFAFGVCYNEITINHGKISPFYRYIARYSIIFHLLCQVVFCRRRGFSVFFVFSPQKILDSLFKRRPCHGYSQHNNFLRNCPSGAFSALGGGSASCEPSNGFCDDETSGFNNMVGSSISPLCKIIRIAFN